MKKLSTILGLGLLSVAFLSACGKEEAGSTTDYDTISILSPYIETEPPASDNEILKQLEAYTGKNIDITWAPNTSYEDKMNITLASDDIPEVMVIQGKSGGFIKSAENGAFWDLTDYLADYPNLSQSNEDVLRNSSVNGKVYGIYRKRDAMRTAVIIRKDWLENLNLDVPETIDDLYEVAKAFTENDPDGNGENDTFGLIIPQWPGSINSNSPYDVLATWFGAGNAWKEIDGTLEPSFMQPEYKEAMEWFRNIYDNGWMNSDFAVMAKNDQKNYIVQGRGGIVLSGLQEVRNYIDDAAGTDEEHMEWVLINDIVHENVERRILSDTNGGMGGWLAIPKNNVETEEDLRVVLKFINDLMDEEPFTLMTQGIEGVHYEIDDEGVYVRLDDTKWQQEVQPFSSSRPSELVTVFPSSNPYVNLANEKIRENEEFAVINPAQSLTSETYDRSWSSLIEGISDAYYQYMTGEIEIDGFDTAIETFLRNGGQQIIDEFTEDYRSQQ